MNLREKKEEVAHAQENLPKRVDASEEMKISWCRTCMIISLLQLMECKRVKDEILAEKQSFLPNAGPAVQC